MSNGRFGQFDLSNLPDAIRNWYAPDDLPVMLDPIPGTTDELRNISERSYSALFGAFAVQELIQNETQGQVQLLLAGSLGIAALFSCMYREIHDADFFISRDEVPAVTQALSRHGYTITYIEDNSIFRIHYVFVDNDKEKTVAVDFCIYDQRGVGSVLGQGGNSIFLGNYPLRGVPYTIYGCKFSVDGEAVARFKANDDTMRRLKAAVDIGFLRHLYPHLMG